MAKGAVGGDFRLLMAQGTLYSSGYQLANVSIVLPFILAQHGVYWAAGLLVPAFSVGMIVGTAGSPAILERSSHRKHLLVAVVSGAMAVLIACNAVAAFLGIAVTAAFLGTSFSMGVVRGVSAVAYPEIVSDKLSVVRRNELIIGQKATGAVMAVTTTLLILPLLSQRHPRSSHADVLWLGAAELAFAAIVAVFVGPVQSNVARTTRTLRDTYREGLGVVRSQRWFQRYAATMLLFVPVTLGTTFYSVHASDHHADKQGSLHALVIFASAGLITGVFLWRLVFQRYGVRGMLRTSALLSCAAATICIVTEIDHTWSKVWVHGIVIVLATIASQAIFAASVSWINAHAAEHQRATVLGVSAILIAVSSTVLGVFLGSIAEYTFAIWPVAILLVLSVIAVIAATAAPAPAPAPVSR